jgi:hypothetical protein
MEHEGEQTNTWMFVKLFTVEVDSVISVVCV